MLAAVELEVENGTQLVGLVKPVNVASRKVFRSLGYQEHYDAGNDCYMYEKMVVNTNKHPFGGGNDTCP